MGKKAIATVIMIWVLLLIMYSVFALGHDSFKLSEWGTSGDPSAVFFGILVLAACILTGIIVYDELDTYY